MRLNLLFLTGKCCHAKTTSHEAAPGMNVPRRNMCRHPVPSGTLPDKYSDPLWILIFCSFEIGSPWGLIPSFRSPGKLLFKNEVPAMPMPIPVSI